MGLFLVVLVGSLLLFVYGAFVVRTVYQDHCNLAKRYAALITENKNLKSTIQQREYFPDMGGAALFDVVTVLQAFQILRSNMNGKPCVLWITSPADSIPLASAIARLSSTVSGCATYGPTGPGNPDLDSETMGGMIPGVIVVHANRGDQGAAAMITQLQNYIQVRLSYKPLSDKFVHYQNQGKMHEDVIWLQFGTGTKWNGQLR